jgi:hypothetical protein
MATKFKIDIEADSSSYKKSIDQSIQDGKNFAKINRDITKEQNVLNRSLQQ